MTTVHVIKNDLTTFKEIKNGECFVLDSSIEGDLLIMKTDARHTVP